MAERNIIRAQNGFQEMFSKTNVDICIGGGVLGCGKENPLDTKILTPKGWTTMGSLHVGDYICTPFGGATKVTHIFEHKNKDIYKITTNDGRSAECGLEHLWAIRTTKQLENYRKNKDVSKNFSVVETSEIIEMLHNKKKVYIQIPFAQDFETKELPIPPYVFGVMLGDGCMSEKTWLQDTHILISSSEDDIVEKVCNIVKSERVYKQPKTFTHKIYTQEAKVYREYCEKENLLVRSYLKHIPKIYLESSIEQRTQLLYGLMDTDGCVMKNNSFTFSTSSERMKDDFIYLCRSLGFQTRIYYDKRLSSTGHGNYTIRILTSKPIFSSKKHLYKYQKWINDEKKFIRESSHVYVTKVEKTRVSDTRCIVVEDPLHLYIIDDFLTTHNSFAAVLASAEPSMDKNFRALYLRNNLGDAKAGGGIVDTFREVYGNSIKVVESGDPHIDFPSGARVDITHVANQSKTAIMQRFKGRQYDLIVFDEGTGYSWETFTAICTRNRGKGKWTGHVLMTTNPEKDHWLRVFLDWYIGPDGFIREDRNGVIRYLYMAGETVEDVVWGDTKEEVYEKCRTDIDKKFDAMGDNSGTITKYDLIQSFTFYLGRFSENKANIERNPGYAGAIAMTGGRMSEQLLEGNWNVSTKGEFDIPIKTSDAEFVFINDPQINGDKWITADLADYGTDNFVALVWDGFHIMDFMIVSRSTPRTNAENLLSLAKEYSIPDNHIIYDAIGGGYIRDYIPEAMAYISHKQPVGVYGRGVCKLKDECYLRLVDVINRKMLSISETIGKQQYVHEKIKERISIKQEFVEECLVVRFREGIAGKKMLFSKKEMKNLLGKERSMDLLDPCAMRMYPVLQYVNGEELVKTSVLLQEETNEIERDRSVDIYDETNWC